MTPKEKYTGSPRAADFNSVGEYRKAYQRWYYQHRKNKNFPLAPMSEKSKLGTAASHLNQNYDRSASIEKEKEIAERVQYLDWDEEFLEGYVGMDGKKLITKESDLPPLITDEIKLIESLQGKTANDA